MNRLIYTKIEPIYGFKIACQDILRNFEKCYEIMKSTMTFLSLLKLMPAVEISIAGINALHKAYLPFLLHKVNFE